MESDRPPPPHFGDYPHGHYWTAERSVTEVNEEENYEIAGTTLRFMWDHGVTVPLWDAEGYLSDDPVWLNRALGLSAELVADLAAWGTANDPTRANHARMTSTEWQAHEADLAHRAEELAQQLRAQLPARFVVQVLL